MIAIPRKEKEEREVGGDPENKLRKVCGFFHRTVVGSSTYDSGRGSRIEEEEG
jgi:hypothetical protein